MNSIQKLRARIKALPEHKAKLRHSHEWDTDRKALHDFRNVLAEIALAAGMGETGIVITSMDQAEKMYLEARGVKQK